MCGRYTLKATAAEMTDHFGVEVPGQDRFNIAPSQMVPAIAADSVKVLKWGLVPSWSKEPKASFSNINARCETVASSPAFRGPFRHRRCLMPADGFYEWAPGPPKVPYHFRLAGGGPFAFAGIWDSWRDELETCALITTEANSVVEVAHARMPAILAKEDYQAWLDPGSTPAELKALLRPFPAGLMAGYPVGPRVNRPANEGPGCVEPA